MAFVPKREILKTSLSKVAIDVIFDASAKTLIVNDPDFREVLFVINATDGLVIYDPNTPSKSGVRTKDLLTFTFDTTSMSDEDDLIVIYEPKEEIEVEVEDLLHSVIQELKKMNYQLTLMTDTHIENQDVEV